VLTSLGQLYLKEGMLEKSRKYFEESIRISPADQAALKGLKDLAAMSTIERGGWTDTTSYREKIRNETQAEIFEKEARTIKTGEDLTLLIENLMQKLQIQPESPALLRELAQLYTQNHQYEEALVTYEKLSQLLPFDEHLQKEMSDLKEQKIHQAIVEVKKELAIHPNHPNLNSKLQDLEHKKKEAGLTECKMRVERYPNNLAYRYELGCLYYDLGKFNEAIQELQSAVKDAQRRTQALYYLGLCFKENGFYDLAEKQLLKVVDELQDMDHFKKEAIYQLGLVYEATEQFQKAVAEYKKIFEVDIGFKDISQKIQKAYKK
jgi:tetratricopeptide (TPR) repeat protein